jgi:hypothetical protein
MTIEFRDFTTDDWAAFAGCEADIPRIAEIGDWAIVLDNCDVGVHHASDEFGGWIGTYPTVVVASMVARTIADWILANPYRDPSGREIEVKFNELGIEEVQ